MKFGSVSSVNGPRRSTVVAVPTKVSEVVTRCGYPRRAWPCVWAPTRWVATDVYRDRTVDLFRRGYPWGARLRNGRAAVRTRLLGRRAVVVGGPDGVRRFYDPRLRRRGALPLPLKLVLFGPGTVHGLDDAEHHLRKAMLLGVITPESVAELGERAQREWASAVERWAGQER